MATGSSSGKKEARIRSSYRFFVGREQAGTPFSADELATVTGWKPGTIGTYLKKKWSQIVHRADDGLRVVGVTSYTEDEYVRLMSQRDHVSADPKRPDLPPEVEALVRKAREAALLALQVYNTPSTVFRTEAFAVLVVIAWTSLFHAIFEKRGKSYFYVEGDGVTPKLVDGDKKAWELDACMVEFWGPTHHAVRKNLDFFTKLRNRVVHRYVPAIDPHVAGECQACLFNFDELLVEQFGSYFAIRESLAIPLQTAALRTFAQAAVLRKLQAKNFEQIKEFIDAYRSDLPQGVYEDPKFSFRVFLVPKTGNHASSSDLAYEFVRYDPNRPDEMAALGKQIVMIKEKQVQVVNANLMKPSQIIKQVEKKLGKPFKMHHHTAAWKRYKVRPTEYDATGSDLRYCVPDQLNRAYGYTPAWIDFLVQKLADKAEYEALVAAGSNQTETPAPAAVSA